MPSACCFYECICERQINDDDDYDDDRYLDVSKWQINDSRLVTIISIRSNHIVEVLFKNSPQTFAIYPLHFRQVQLSLSNDYQITPNRCMQWESIGFTFPFPAANPVGKRWYGMWNVSSRGLLGFGAGTMPASSSSMHRYLRLLVASSSPSSFVPFTIRKTIRWSQVVPKKQRPHLTYTATALWKVRGHCFSQRKS